MRILQHAPEEPAIEVAVPPTDDVGFAALVRLRGEHDLSTATEVKATLRSISGNVLVDLADCAFIDSSIIGALVTTSHELEREGHVLALFVPAENTTIARTLEITQMRDLVVMYDTRTPRRPVSQRSYAEATMARDAPSSHAHEAEIRGAA